MFWKPWKRKSPKEDSPIRYQTIALPSELSFVEPLGAEAVVGTMGRHASCNLAAYGLCGECLWQHEPCQLATIHGDECWT
jgi:hypothetical protein